MTEKMCLRVVEAAKALSIGRGKAYEMVASGELPSIRIGRRVLVPVDGLHEWVRRRTNDSSVKVEGRNDGEATR